MINKDKATSEIVTRLVQPDYAHQPSFKSLTNSVARASTVVFESVEHLRKRDWTDKKQFTYGLLGTPTTRLLEQKLADIDGVAHAVLAPSGLAAISIVMMALLKTNDVVYLPYNAYVPALVFAQLLAKQYGVIVKRYDPINIESLEFLPNTKLIWVETPGSVTMEVADLSAIADLAHKHGVIVAVDATWSAGIALSVFKHGTDISIQALTKYQSGGSDVMMGCITSNNNILHKRILNTAVTFGSGVSPEDCQLILRSLPHYALRYASQDVVARSIAAWLRSVSVIEQVLHPALKDAPGHSIWQRDFTGAASLFSIVFKGNIQQKQIDAWVEALDLFHLGFSWGGAVSLVVPFTKDEMHDAYQYEGSLVRLYIGLENESDLLADLKQAFEKVQLS
jgi:cysteine-S-conjugate beta-lyase